MIHYKKYFYIISLMMIGGSSIVCTGPDSLTKWPTAAWEVSSATSQGMNYDSLAAFSRELESGELGYIDGMLVIRNGTIVFEKEYIRQIWIESVYSDYFYTEYGLHYL